MNLPIKIRWIYDSHECETCGTTYAEGAIVSFPDGSNLEMIPHAHCFGGTHYSDTDIYSAIFEKLGYDLQEEYDES